MDIQRSPIDWLSAARAIRAIEVQRAGELAI
jgi:hypothetical protein